MISRYLAFVRRFRWPVTVVWVLALVAGAYVSRGLPSQLSGGGWSVPGSASAHVDDSLRSGFVARGPSTVTVVVHDRWYTADQPGFQRRAEQAVATVVADKSLTVRSQLGWATTSGTAQQAYLGKDRRTVVEQLALSMPDGTARQVLPTVQDQLTKRFAGQGLDVSLVGAASFWGEVNQLSETGLARAEMITLPLILLVLVLLFGGVVAALASLTVGVTSILFSFVVLTVVARHTELSVFVTNTATMLGLGIGVDYSLFIIARFKSELREGHSVDDALARTLRTSGETVVASGVTVLAAMATLFLVPLGVIHSIALGAVVVVAFSVLASAVLLPVVLHLLGPRIARGVVYTPKGAHRRAGTQRWEVLAERIMKRPVAFLTLGLVILLALALPGLTLRTFTPDAQIIPAASPVRAGFDQMQAQFGTGSTSPVIVLVESAQPLYEADGASARLAALQQRIATHADVAAVGGPLGVLQSASAQDPVAALAPAPRAALPQQARALVGHYVSDDARRVVFEVVPTGHPSDPSTQALWRHVRDDAAAASGQGLDVVVGGETAQGVESNNVIQDRLPSVVLAMLAVMYALMLLAFRSILLPLKAIALNLVSVAATFGVLVLVFQHGYGASLLGAGGAGYIQNFVPVLLITLLFSLSTDYEVFLLNRVREAHAEGRSNERSVAEGLSATAPLISGAALLMVVVFGAFAFAGILPIKQLGFGMAVAIALDATIVRLVLVPASMRLMGEWNWWLPRVGRRVRRRPSRAVVDVRQVAPAPKTDAEATTAGPARALATASEGAARRS